MVRRAFEVHPIVSTRIANSPFVRGWLARWFLPYLFGWFGGVVVVNLIRFPGSLGIDARLYHRAAVEAVRHGDAWSVTAGNDLHFAGPPTTLLPYLPFVGVPEDLFVVGHVIACAIAAVLVLRRLRLPPWWLAFPPLLEGVWVANLNIIVLGLLLLSSPAAGAFAAVLKIYAALTLALLFRLKALITLTVLIAITYPLLPWETFISENAQIRQLLADQAFGGRQTLLVAPVWILVAASLVYLGRERSAWLVVPALWPATQLHYSVFALPVMHPILAVAMSVPYPGMAGVGVIAFVAYELAKSKRFQSWNANRPRLPGVQREGGEAKHEVSG